MLDQLVIRSVVHVKDTNRYKGVVTQREFSDSEARQRVKEHSYPTFKLVNTVSEVLKLAFQECFWRPTSVLIEFKRDHHSLTHSP